MVNQNQNKELTSGQKQISKWKSWAIKFFLCFSLSIILADVTQNVSDKECPGWPRVEQSAFHYAMIGSSVATFLGMTLCVVICMIVVHEELGRDR